MFEYTEFGKAMRNAIMYGSGFVIGGRSIHPMYIVIDREPVSYDHVVFDNQHRER